MPAELPNHTHLPKHQPSTALRRTLAAMRREVRDLGLWQPGHKVLAACSGGADSMAMTALLQLLEPSLGHQTVVGHVDHGLQAQSGSWRGQVEEWSQSVGLPFVCRSLQLMGGAQVEARAREARYAALHEMADALGCQFIATAHHADDQAETFLLRASRGAGPDALAGVRRQLGRLVRPVLSLPRATLLQVAAELALPAVQDPSNADWTMTRNHLRHKVLPALEAAVPGAAAAMARTAALAAEQEQATTTWLELALQDRTQRPKPGELLVAFLPPTRVSRATLWRWAASQLGTPAPSVRATEQLEAAALRSGDQQVRIAGLVVSKQGAMWHFVRQDVAQPRGAD